jgi:2-C-methyl-D-erythritol 4-phosphate cytidylyltransferase
MAASALIVAGGSGVRYGWKKQFIPLAGIPVLKRSVLCFDSHPGITHIIVVVPAEDSHHVSEILEGMKTPLTITAGGATRQESVWKGLQIETPNDIVLIHDGVRPLVSADIISRVLNGIVGFDACIPGIAVSDTIKEGHDEYVARTISRADLYQIQTPQAFKKNRILEAHESAKNNDLEPVTDDSTLIENLGGKVRLVQGDPFNIKITLKEDIYIAEALLKCRTQ